MNTFKRLSDKISANLNSALDKAENPEKMLDALNLEYRKDFYAEGQYFHFLKLHEMTTFLNCPLTGGMTAEQYVFPLPDAEREYGWTDSMSGTTGSDSEEAQ